MKQPNTNTNANAGGVAATAAAAAAALAPDEANSSSSSSSSSSTSRAGAGAAGTAAIPPPPRPSPKPAGDGGGVPDFQPTTEVVGGRYMFIRNVYIHRHPERNTFGLQLKSPAEKFRTNSIGCLVKAVLPSCSAPEGSIQPEDQVLSINHHTALDWTYHEIVTFIKEQNPDHLVLSFRRELPKPPAAATTATAMATTSMTTTSMTTTATATATAAKTANKTGTKIKTEGTDTVTDGTTSATSDDGASASDDAASYADNTRSKAKKDNVDPEGAGKSAAKGNGKTNTTSKEAKRNGNEKTVAAKAAPGALPTIGTSTAKPADAASVVTQQQEDTKMADVADSTARPGTTVVPPGATGGTNGTAAPVQSTVPALPALIPPSSSSSSNVGAAGTSTASTAATTTTTEDGPAKSEKSLERKPSSSLAAATFNSATPADSNSKADANASSILPPLVTNPTPTATVHPPASTSTAVGIHNALAPSVMADGTAAAVQPDPKMPSGGKENDGNGGGGDAKTSSGSTLVDKKTGESKPKKKRGRPPKKKKAEGSAAASGGGDAPAGKDGQKTKKRKKSKGAGDASTTDSVGSGPASFDIAGMFRPGDATPDLTFTSEKGEGETDVDRLIKATIGAQASNLSVPDKPELASPPRIKFVFISAPIREGRVAAEIVLNDVKIGSIFAEFVCKSANFVEKCELIGREFPDLEVAAGDLFKEGGQLHCQELQDYRDEWEPKNRPLEEAYYLQIKHIHVQKTEFGTEEEQSDIVAHVLHLFLRDPKVKRWKIAGYKTVHDVGEFYVPDDEIARCPGSPEEVVEQKWVEREAQKNKQLGVDARPFVRVGFQEVGAESSEHKGIIFVTKKMFLPEKEIQSHAQAVERKLRCDAPVNVEEYRKLKLKTEFLDVILKEDAEEELDSRRFNSQTSLHRAPETYDMDGELVKKFMPQIEEFIAKGADIKESQILHATAHRHYLGLLKPLIEKGADVNAFDNNSMTPLMIVAANIGKRIEINADRSLRIIWDLRSLCNADRNLRDRAGRTALGHYYRAWRDVRGIDREVGAPIKDTPINKSIEDMLCPDGGPTDADKRAKAGG